MAIKFWTRVVENKCSRSTQGRVMVPFDPNSGADGMASNWLYYAGYGRGDANSGGMEEFVVGVLPAPKDYVHEHTGTRA